MSGPGHKLDAMERPHLKTTPRQIEVLDGQISVEELLADLGFEWRPQYVGTLASRQSGSSASPFCASLPSS